MLPPPVVTFSDPEQRCTSMLPPPVSSTAPCMPETTTHAAAAGLGIDLALGGGHLDAAAAGAQRKLPADGSYVDAAATSFGIDPASDVIQTNAAASGFTLDPAANAGGSEIAAVSLDLHQINIARNIDNEFAGGTARPAAFPFAPPPRPCLRGRKR